MENYFDLGLAQQGDIFIEPSYRLDPGFESHLRIYPLVLTATNEALKLRVGTRECKMPEEAEGDTFHQYSQGNCHLECLVDQIYSEMKDPCLPWDFPRTTHTRGAKVCSGQKEFGK